MPLMLKSAYYNTGSNPYLLGKCLDSNLFAIRLTGNKLMPISRINQYIGSKYIRLPLYILTILLIYFRIQKKLTFSMKENMACFVEKRKPELIIGFITQAE